MKNTFALSFLCLAGSLSGMEEAHKSLIGQLVALKSAIWFGQTKFEVEEITTRKATKEELATLAKDQRAGVHGATISLYDQTHSHNTTINALVIKVDSDDDKCCWTIKHIIKD
jgi:hypothetical protein